VRSKADDMAGLV